MKERVEWINSWCEETLNKDLPRVLLVGDSITMGYQDKVRQKLKGVCYVDFIATSYALDAKFYNELICKFASDSDYRLIHFNQGLHGQHIQKRSYKSRLKKITEKLSKNAKIVLATSTIVYAEGNTRLDRVWTKKLKERNDAVYELSAENGYPVDDLYYVSIGIPTDSRSIDGVHYTDAGYEIFAVAVAESIAANLK